MKARYSILGVLGLVAVTGYVRHLMSDSPRPAVQREDSRFVGVTALDRVRAVDGIHWQCSVPNPSQEEWVVDVSRATMTERASLVSCTERVGPGAECIVRGVLNARFADRDVKERVLLPLVDSRDAIVCEITATVVASPRLVPAHLRVEVASDATSFTGLSELRIDDVADPAVVEVFDQTAGVECLMAKGRVEGESYVVPLSVLGGIDLGQVEAGFVAYLRCSWPLGIEELTLTVEVVRATPVAVAPRVLLVSPDSKAAMVVADNEVSRSSGFSIRVEPPEAGSAVAKGDGIVDVQVSNGFVSGQTWVVGYASGVETFRVPCVRLIR